MKNAYCAIDLGATSGRIVLSSDGLELEEIYRFPNSIYEQEGRYFWDTDRLMSEIMTGLRLLTSRDDIHVCSIGVDTWGVDVVFLIGAGAPASAQARVVMAPTVATDLQENTITTTAEKVIKDGTIYILRGDKIYTTTGQLVK